MTLRYKEENFAQLHNNEAESFAKNQSSKSAKYFEDCVQGAKFANLVTLTLLCDLNVRGRIRCAQIFYIFCDKDFFVMKMSRLVTSKQARKKEIKDRQAWRSLRILNRF